MYKGLAGLALVAMLGLAAGCTEDDAAADDTTPPATAMTYRGSLYDPVLDAALTGYGMNYDSSWYIYTINPENTYAVGMTFGMPAAKMEEGTWAKAGGAYTFTPTACWKTQGAGTLVPVSPDSVKVPYTGVESGTSIAFTDYISSQDLRNLGALTIWMQ